MRWPWQRDDAQTPTLDVLSATPEQVAEITGQPKLPPQPEYGSWRIEKDPHGERFHCQRWGIVGVGMISYFSYPYWFTAHTADSEQAARQWIAEEQLRPIIVAEISAKADCA